MENGSSERRDNKAVSHSKTVECGIIEPCISLPDTESCEGDLYHFLPNEILRICEPEPSVRIC